MEENVQDNFVGNLPLEYKQFLQGLLLVLLFCTDFFGHSKTHYGSEFQTMVASLYCRMQSSLAYPPSPGDA